MAKGVGFYNQDWFVIKTGKDLIYESIIRIIMTSPGERLMRPDFGGGLRDELFNVITQDTLQDLVVKIHRSIAEYEPRVNVDEVTATLAAENTIRLGIIFREPQDRVPKTLELDYVLPS